MFEKDATLAQSDARFLTDGESLLCNTTALGKE